VTAVAVIRRPAQTHVRPDEERGTGLFDRGDRLRNEALRIKRCACLGILLSGRRKQDNGGDARLQRHLCFLYRLIHRELADARHAHDRPAHSTSRHNKERIDERIARQARLTHHAPPAIGLAHTPRSLQGMSHRYGLVCNKRKVVLASPASVADSASTAIVPRSASARAVVGPIATTTA